MTLADVVIILARPSEPGNVGAVCRAMKNMGLSRMRLVFEGLPAGAILPEGAVPLNEAVVRARAVHAVDVWEQAETFPTLAAALADCSLAIGTTRRRGHSRKAVTMDPAETAAFLRERRQSPGGGPAALVFGNERTGLEDGELALCSLASHIPAADAFPSLNLSHAVQIYAYEIYRALSPAGGVEGQWVPLDRQRQDALVARVTHSLESLGFYKRPGRTEQERFLRDIFARAALTEGESRYLGNIFAKAAKLGKKAVRD